MLNAFAFCEIQNENLYRENEKLPSYRVNGNYFLEIDLKTFTIPFPKV